MSGRGGGVDTSIGGTQRDFPSTNWSQLVGDRRGDADARRAAWTALATAYWKPIYFYVRTNWAKSNEDAKDLAQDFLLWVMESPLLLRADASRGRFRDFLKHALRQYLQNQERDRRRLKRGGDRRLLPLDGLLEDPHWELPDPRGRSPEDILDEAWRAEILSRAAHLLRESYRAENREIYFRVFQDYFQRDSEELNYQKVAATHGIAESDVSNYLMNAKRRFRSILRDLVAETVHGADELRAELSELFAEEE